MIGGKSWFDLAYQWDKKKEDGISEESGNADMNTNIE